MLKSLLLPLYVAWLPIILPAIVAPVILLSFWMILFSTIQFVITVLCPTETCGPITEFLMIALSPIWQGWIITEFSIFALSETLLVFFSNSRTRWFEYTVAFLFPQSNHSLTVPVLNFVPFYFMFSKALVNWNSPFSLISLSIKYCSSLDKNSPSLK